MSPTRDEIQSLLAFLPALSKPGRAFVVHRGGGEPTGDGGANTSPWPVYDDDVVAFFREASRPCWQDHQYDPRTARESLDDPTSLASLDLPGIRSMLTYCVRSERFCDGSWGALLEDGVVQRLLERLALLHEKGLGETVEAQQAPEKTGCRASWGVGCGCLALTTLGAGLMTAALALAWWL